jgi:hypothetical protein
MQDNTLDCKSYVLSQANLSLIHQGCIDPRACPAVWPVGIVSHQGRFIHVHHHPLEVIHLLAIFAVSPVPYLVTFGDEAPNQVLQPTLRGNGVEHFLSRPQKGSNQHLLY